MMEVLQGRSQDARRFPHHIEVLRYLELYAERFNLLSAVKLNTEVVSVAPGPSPHVCPQDNAASTESGASPTRASSSASLSTASDMDRSLSWRVTTRAAGSSDSTEQHTATYDAVMICNGHYSVPRIPELKGMDQFPGTCLHSHNYRKPGQYDGLKVVLIGAKNSGTNFS
jgi:hypothetical protein